MYSRTTRNKILASILLLIITLCASGDNKSYADTNIFAESFSPSEVLLETPSPSPDTVPTATPTPIISESTPTPEVTPTPEISPTPGVELDNITTPSPTPPPDDAPTLSENNGKVFIYHSHTNEAYLKSEADRDVNPAGRSNDASITVKAAGEALKNSLAMLGIDTDHDLTNNEANGYSSAYKTSHITVQNAIAQNGKYTAYLDIHRDAFIKGTIPTVKINGENVARIMLVVGGSSPHASGNHEFAKKIMAELNKIHPSLCEKVLYVQNSAYNKIESDNCVIVEIGDNNVTTEEACRAANYVAEAVAKVLNS